MKKPILAEIGLVYASAEDVQNSPHMGIYNRANNPDHPKGIRCHDPQNAKILETLQPDGLYHLAAYDPQIFDPTTGVKKNPDDHPMMALQQMGNQQYLYGRDAAELVARTINELVETKMLDLKNLDLSAHNPPQLINTHQWEQIHALTGPLNRQDTAALSNGLVIEATINGQQTNIAYQEPEGIIKTDWPAYHVIQETMDFLLTERSHPLLKDTTVAQLDAYVRAITDAIPPTREQLQTGNMTGMAPPPRYHYGVYISELNSLQIADNTLTPFSPSGEVKTTLLQPLKESLDSIKPDAQYRVSINADAGYGVIPIYRNEGGKLLNALEEIMRDKLEGHYVTGKDIKGVLSNLITESNNHLDQKATVPYLELRNNQFTISAKQLAAIEKQLGPLDSFSLYQLTTGKPITIDNTGYAYSVRDGKPGINPVNQPETTTTPATLIDKPAGDKNVLIYRQAADQFGVMLSPETITRLLSGQRSDMLMAVDNKVGKLILMNQPDSPPVLKLLEKKEQLTIPTKVAGYALTTTDRDNLTKYGEMGKLVPMVSAAGKPFNGYVGIDKDLNTITVLKEHQFKLPQSIKGVTLDASQREQLKGGHSVPLENMEGKNGPFHAFVRISASNGKLTFQPIRNIEAYKKSVVPPAQTAEATPNKSVARPGPTRQPLTPAVTVRTNAAPALGTAKNKPDKALTTNLRQSESNKSKPVPKQSRPKQKIK